MILQLRAPSEGCERQNWTGQLARAGTRLFRPAFHHYPRALAQRDPRRWPAGDRRPVGRLRDLEVIDPSDVLDDAVRGAVPNIHAEGKVSLGLHGQVRPDWPAPRAIYTPCCCVA
jgi:hypothetical protein